MLLFFASLPAQCLEYVNRCLAEEDVAGGADGTPLASVVAEAAEGCEGLYKAGDFASSGIPRLEVFLLKKVLKAAPTVVYITSCCYLLFSVIHKLLGSALGSSALKMLPLLHFCALACLCLVFL